MGSFGAQRPRDDGLIRSTETQEASKREQRLRLAWKVEWNWPEGTGVKVLFWDVGGPACFLSRPPHREERAVRTVHFCAWHRDRLGAD